ncbi:membrane protein insertase YidC [Asticcacaulis taihuensis]|uniref:Membrane protein insertase YidC n=1 Tax=Asticcacaulis taihuensis TaxID=260084 RepID=A0A1G4QL42_9CAUL|nr:membrane protein insertase YidC [Asticcacaulis taihuensis]SCW44779.1 YidC/Oxa1 family membrane protein insertase [Asticcacaulis taihuensis]
MNNTTDNKNMIYFLVISMAVLAIYQFFVFGPQQKKREAAMQVAAAASSSAAAKGLPLGGVSTTLTREQALATSPRITISTPSLKGSIALKGALLDDLYMIKYDQTVEKKNDPVELLTPAGAKNAYYVQSAYFAQNVPGMPDNNTVWTQTGGSVLSPGHPVVLSYDNGTGLTFTRTLSIDANYMITEDDAVTNTGAAPVSFQPFSVVMRSGMPADAGKNAVVHEGAIATYSKTMDKPKLGDYRTASLKYKDMAKPKDGKALESQDSVGGWYGITDKYWMAAVIPNQTQAVSYTAKAIVTDGVPVFRSGYVDAPVTVAPGQTWKAQSHVFAGAKQNTQLQAYEDSLHIPRFHWAVDWGMLSIITYPMYWLLDKLYAFLGNFGFAILALTVIVKVVFYPLAHRSYESMTKMRQVQDRLKPKLDAIKKRFPDDMQKQQEATMALYQEEKVNPMAGLGGCLPMLLQIPVFWSLYKVLQLAIEMRHAPFFGWINDLSAPDSTTIINLFGLLPFDPATVPLIGTILAGPLHIGVVAILYGCSMWLSQQMTPMTGVDPMQKKMMAFMPLMLTFFMAHVAVGLIIYWIWSNILTILQQYSIMHRLKVSNPIDTGFQKLGEMMNKGKKAA